MHIFIHEARLSPLVVWSTCDAIAGREKSVEAKKYVPRIQNVAEVPNMRVMSRENTADIASIRLCRRESMSMKSRGVGKYRGEHKKVRSCENVSRKIPIPPSL